MLLRKEVSEASIAKIVGVSRTAFHHFIRTQKLDPRASKGRTQRLRLQNPSPQQSGQHLAFCRAVRARGNAYSRLSIGLISSTRGRSANGLIRDSPDILDSLVASLERRSAGCLPPDFRDGGSGSSA